MTYILAHADSQAPEHYAKFAINNPVIISILKITEILIRT